MLHREKQQPWHWGETLCFHCSAYGQSCFAAQTRGSGNRKHIEPAPARASATPFLTPIAFFLCSILVF